MRLGDGVRPVHGEPYEPCRGLSESSGDCWRGLSKQGPPVRGQRKWPWVATGQGTLQLCVCVCVRVRVCARVCVCE